MSTFSYTERILGPGGKILRARLMEEIDLGQSLLQDYLGLGTPKGGIIGVDDKKKKLSKNEKQEDVRETQDFLKSMGDLVYIALGEIKNRIIKQLDTTLETAQEMNKGNGNDYLKDRSDKFMKHDQSNKCISPKYQNEFKELLYNIFKARVDVYRKIMESYEKANEKTYAELVKAAWPNKNDARKAFFKEFVHQKRMLNKIKSKPEIIRDNLYGISRVRKPMLGILNAVFDCAIIQLRENLDEVYKPEVYIPVPLVSNGINAK